MLADHNVLETVIEYYLNSGDFNGLYVAKGRLSDAEIDEVADLVRAGLLQVVGEEDYPNPHIRPWASKRSVNDQVADVTRVNDGRRFCLYPTPQAMEGRAELTSFGQEPYKRRLAAGRGTLELAYFTVDV